MVTEHATHNPCGGHLALDFVNSIGRSPDSLGIERLVDFPALVRWSLEAGSLSEADARPLLRHARAHPRAAAHALGRARALREALFATFHADVRGTPPPRSDLDLVNAEWKRALAHACLEPGEEGYVWSWSARPDELDRPLWPIVHAASELLASEERALIKECHAEDCIWVFLDRSRNHRRRWCEMKGCGNRAKVRKHRGRNPA